MAFRNLPGGVPEPEELVGREHLIEVLWSQLRTVNIHLVAPRRFGKTGVMRHVLKLPRDSYLPVYLDVEELSEPQKFAAELLAALLQHDKLRSLIVRAKALPSALRQWVTDWVEDIEVESVRIKLRQNLGEAWEETARKLVLEMENADATVVFIIDEFPEFLANVCRKQGDEAARGFLAWFRSVRMRQKDELRRFRFIIGGSTSIDTTLRRLDVPDKLNDFFRLAVEPLAPGDAEALLLGLEQSYGFCLDAAARKTLFELIGAPVPYFIHLFVSQIIVDREVRGKLFTPEDVRAVYQGRLLGATCREYFNYYRLRLKRYGADGERAAIAILREIANSPIGRVADSSLYAAYRKARRKGASELEFLEIIADLECDWYVTLDTTTNEYYFRLEIMRAWWHRFYRDVGKKARKEEAR